MSKLYDILWPVCVAAVCVILGALILPEVPLIVWQIAGTIGAIGLALFGLFVFIASRGS